MVAQRNVATSTWAWWRSTTSPPALKPSKTGLCPSQARKRRAAVGVVRGVLLGFAMVRHDRDGTIAVVVWGVRRGGVLLSVAPVQAVIRTSRWCGGQSGAAVPPTDQIGTPAATTNWRVVMIRSFLAYRVCPLLSNPKECPFSGQIGYACCGASHGTGSRPVRVPLVVSRRRGESVRIVSPHSNNPSCYSARIVFDLPVLSQHLLRSCSSTVRGG